MITTKNKILLSVPAVTATGGIKNYFQSLKSKFTLPVEYIERGARTWPYREGFLPESKRFVLDIIRFRKKIKTREYSIVQTSTSLGLYSVIRDAIFLRIAQANNIKTIVFFRGWDKGFEEKIEKNYLNIFRHLFFNADMLIVLSPEFEVVLKRWGYKKKIVIETTLIDSDLIKEFNLEQIVKDKVEKRESKINILFLARTETPKGIYEAINAYRIVKEEMPGFDLSLTIAGDGIEFEDMKEYVQKVAVNNVEILGSVEGGDKIRVFRDADIYLFPTYTEGMPNSVLEAMAFGLPIVAGKAGAIPYIIKNEINGYVTDSSDPALLASLLQKLINDKGLRIEMTKNNFIKAEKEFYSDRVVKRMEKIYLDVLAGV